MSQNVLESEREVTHAKEESTRLKSELEYYKARFDSFVESKSCDEIHWQRILQGFLNDWTFSSCLKRTKFMVACLQLIFVLLSIILFLEKTEIQANKESEMTKLSNMVKKLEKEIVREVKNYFFYVSPTPIFVSYASLISLQIFHDNFIMPNFRKTTEDQFRILTVSLFHIWN